MAASTTCELSTSEGRLGSLLSGASPRFRGEHPPTGRSEVDRAPSRLTVERVLLPVEQLLVPVAGDLRVVERLLRRVAARLGGFDRCTPVRDPRCIAAADVEVAPLRVGVLLIVSVACCSRSVIAWLRSAVA
ncbi:MAG: hypothetical protein WEB03_11515 [Nitriliruptor sp.]|uniref:hypothetical protein n=1 Tax=Nitriliruptor sp. TaxID=2448056 RepID=UPI0034A039B8